MWCRTINFVIFFTSYSYYSLPQSNIDLTDQWQFISKCLSIDIDKHTEYFFGIRLIYCECEVVVSMMTPGNRFLIATIQRNGPETNT